MSTNHHADDRQTIDPIATALAAIRWRIRRQNLILEARKLERLIAQLGIPVSPGGDLRESGNRIPEAAVALAPFARVPAELESRSPVAKEGPNNVAGRVAASVCSRSHLHLSRTMVRSLRQAHPEIPVFVLLVDGEPADLENVPGARVILPSDIGFPEPYDLVKFTAFQACAASKAPLVRWLLELGAREVVFLDSDIRVYSPMHRLLDPLGNSDVVVVPHLREPFPINAWERPTIVDVSHAGVLNSGLWAVRNSPAARRFMRQWEMMMRAPQAFCSVAGAEWEQQAFNWATAFVDSVAVVRDPQVNVAYWNLHERSLRRRQVSGEDLWSIDGEPLETFHFSGFEVENPNRISKWDGRHSSWSHGELAALSGAYHQELVDSGARTWSGYAYRYDRFPSGLSIDHRMRELFKTYENDLFEHLDPFTIDGERHYCQKLLRPNPSGPTALPILLQQIWWDRPDLKASFPQADIDPGPLLRWFTAEGARELNYQELVDRHRPTIPTLEGLTTWRRIQDATPEVFEHLEAPLGEDRQRLFEHLSTCGLDPVVTADRELEHEIWAISPIWMLRTLYSSREDLHSSFVDPLFGDAEDFEDWIRECGQRTDFLPAGTDRAFRRTCRGRSLVRLFSFLSRDWERGRWMGSALCGVDSDELMRVLYTFLEHQPEYDIDDIVMFGWLLEQRPESGLHLALELTRQFPEAGSDVTTIADQDRRLAAALTSHAAQVELARIRYQQEISGRLPATIDGFSSRGPDVNRTERSPSQFGWQQGGIRRAGAEFGVNCFGYFCSPIGLGNMSRGLVRALDAASIRNQEVQLTTHIMDDRLDQERFVDVFEPEFDTNIFVAYPHHETDLLRLQPPERIRGRRNIAYLAWELDDGNPGWARVFRHYDQLWALSEFAARALSRSLGRSVRPLPCCLDLDLLPPAHSLRDLGFTDKFTALTVFDASSSIERKNPEAVLEAFASAFSANEPARLIVRVANGYRPHHRHRLRALQRQALTSGLEVHFLTDRMTHDQVLSLISACDCYLSLHRAEGFGLTCAEAMAYRKPVIATAASGNLDYMTEDSAILIPADHSEVQVAEGPFRRGMPWWEPRVSIAADALRALYENRALGRKLGTRAHRQVAQLLSPTTIGRQISELLDDGERSDRRRSMTGRPEDPRPGTDDPDTEISNLLTSSGEHPTFRPAAVDQ